MTDRYVEDAIISKMSELEGRLLTLEIQRGYKQPVNDAYLELIKLYKDERGHTEIARRLFYRQEIEKLNQIIENQREEIARLKQEIEK